ncbi:MAG: hypothetical protein HZB42_06775 [Sphingobacteriales bacterium]|nr:hypothetical protein [Sphingobacteriales bacterium]
MKLLLIPALLFALASCSPGIKTTNTATTTTAATHSEKDGSSYEKAIVINEKSEGPGIAAEYKWLRENYPGYKLISQSLNGKDGKKYDIMAIETRDGEKKTIYFDITKYFGHF